MADQSDSEKPKMPGRRGTLGWLGGLLLDRTEPVIHAFIVFCGWSAIIAVTAIFIFIFKEAAPIVPRLDWGEFFFSLNWNPVPGGEEPSYGALGLLVGTFSVTILGMLLAIPIGLSAAVYISEFAKPKVKETFKIIIELLAAIPSIVWGFIGLVVLSPIIQLIPGVYVGTNLLNAGVIIAFMAVPLIVSISEDALRAVPDSYREAATALGASKWEMVYRVLFPAAKNGLLAACMLGVGRAVGETMAVLLASGNANNIPMALTDPVKTMTATIASEFGDAEFGGDHYRVLFTIGVLLFIITCAINVTSDFIVKGIRKQDG